MFSYYGGKGKLAKMYPPPQYGVIVEPFAGAARYACLYPDYEVILCDKFHKIVEVWRYLRAASKHDILSLPDIVPGDDLRRHTYLSDAERWFLGFQINGGTSDTRYTVIDPTFNRWTTGRLRIASFVDRIRHWQIIHGDYQCLGNTWATWFIDPPYKLKGREYRHGAKDIDYSVLGEYCKSRQGQVIVCEGKDANWLPFKHLTMMRGSNFTSPEMIWTNASK